MSLLSIQDFVERMDEQLALLRRLVETESPSTDKAAVDRVGALVAAEARRLGAVVSLDPQSVAGDNVVARWTGDPRLSQVNSVLEAYEGPYALMSFDPDVMTVMRELATEIPRGIISGSYRDEHGETWWRASVPVRRSVTRRARSEPRSSPSSSSCPASSCSPRTRPSGSCPRQASRSRSPKSAPSYPEGVITGLRPPG